MRSVTQGGVTCRSCRPRASRRVRRPTSRSCCAALKAALGDAVADVRATDRLVDSAVVLAAAGFGPDLQMQRLMRRHGRDGYGPAPALEVNPRHALIHSLAQKLEAGADLADTAHTLFDLARVQDGEMPTDPAAFARRITAVLAG